MSAVRPQVRTVVPLPSAPAFFKFRRALNEQNLNTVCAEANCPNVGECWSHKVATFMIGGPRCSRNCPYCAVGFGDLTPLDGGESERIGQMLGELGLAYAVITSVNRDDLPDGLAGHFAATVAAIRHHAPDCKIEILTPDFAGKPGAIETLLRHPPDVFSHNLETIPRLYPGIRVGNVATSLALLADIHRAAPTIPVKTALMLGLGEERLEVVELLGRVAEAGVSILALGQYLQPSKPSLPVVRHWAQAEFDDLAEVARAAGIPFVEAGPLVRSSFRADRAGMQAINEKRPSPLMGRGSG